VLGNRSGGFLVDLLRVNTAHRVRRRMSVPVLAVSRPAEQPYRRMLLATDLSPESAHAGRVARRLFPALSLHMMHVCQPPYEGTLAFAGVERDAIEAYRTQSLDEARLELQKFGRDAYLGLDAELDVRLGDPAAQIRRYVTDEAIDVVVLCPARSWLARGMANSVTEQLLADPPCDALLVG
jgi:nucleotide-binding universal stress UspA family protein